MSYVIVPGRLGATVPVRDVVDEISAACHEYLGPSKQWVSPIRSDGFGLRDAAAAAGSTRSFHTPVDHPAPPGACYDRSGVHRRPPSQRDERVDVAMVPVPDGVVAVIEADEALGAEARHPDPMRRTSWQLGELIRLVATSGVQRIVINCVEELLVDGGMGCMAALGVRFSDGAGTPIDPIAGNLGRVAHVDTTQLNPRMAATQVQVIARTGCLLTGCQSPLAAELQSSIGRSRGSAIAIARWLQQYSATVSTDRLLDIATVPGGGGAGGAAGALQVLGGAGFLDQWTAATEWSELPDRIANSSLLMYCVASDPTGSAPGDLEVECTRARATGSPVVGRVRRLTGSGMGIGVDIEAPAAAFDRADVVACASTTFNDDYRIGDVGRTVTTALVYATHAALIDRPTRRDLPPPI